MPSLDLTEAAGRLDHEADLAKRYLTLVAAWHEARLAGDAETLSRLTRESVALRSRLCGIMLRSIGESFRDRGSEGFAATLADLSTKLGLSALQFAREHDLEWGSDEHPGD